MRQILTIFWDSYRLLTAKKLFWIALSFSIMIAMIYASIDISEGGFSLLFGAVTIGAGGMDIPGELLQYMYLQIFTDMLVPFWLGLFAIVLALISVCSVFPNFLESGSIDVAVSKPISRVALFLAKYFSSLLFVGIQVTVFCVIVFLAFGFRMESWNFGIFWAVPLIVFVFSLIYSVAVLTAVWTKSTLLSLLMALLVWGVSWGVQMAESFTYKFAYTAPASGMQIDLAGGGVEMTGEEKESNPGFIKLHRVVKMAGTPLPKTRDVTYLLKSKIKINGKALNESSEFLHTDDGYAEHEITAIEDYGRRHSELYVIGSSLAFEVVVISLACFIFVRRDY